ncbi:Aste57867_24872 [Aphanomyces stellatus]|uniref:Aste57867_24872 protein n=1 Tax=Aphanomyces stellatus TaxID=120398 RepID=A0A485LRL2_9STRA|nr:hypothetical protein As57867_024794 [Aphanomyces stellatus]VFU01506.1 Aste57867_24872 [Aphanomyces stellatus]
MRAGAVDRTVTPHVGKQVDVLASGHKNDETEVIQNVECIVLASILAPKAVIVIQQLVELMSHECTVARDPRADETILKHYRHTVKEKPLITIIKLLYELCLTILK